MTRKTQIELKDSAGRLVWLCSELAAGNQFSAATLQRFEAQGRKALRLLETETEEN